MWRKDAPADHVTIAWLAEVCNGKAQYRKVYSSFTQIVGKITVRINKRKIIKFWLPKIYMVTNQVTYFTKQRQGVEKNTATVTCTIRESLIGRPPSCVICAGFCS
jgi:uncharacterized membrane protein YfhO